MSLPAPFQTAAPERGSAKPSAKRMPRVAFFVYPTAFQSPGGGEIQLLKTKEYLEKRGVEIQFFNPWNDKLEAFDILHTFGSVKDCLDMIKTAKVLGVKTVLSTICWYSWQSAWGIYTQPDKRLQSMTHQFAKTFFPVWPSLRKSMMEVSDLLYPNSECEARQLSRYFMMPKDKIFVVPNGVDPVFETASPDPFVHEYGLKNFILCVGRIEPRKNQLNMIRALKNIKVPLVFIGDYVHQYRDYYIACRREADSNVFFLQCMPHDSNLLASAYAACNTFLLASWLETPGLAALEAGLAGAKVVITSEGATREYFANYATYVSPVGLKQIREMTLRAYESPRNNNLRDHIRRNYLWERAAEKTLEGYQRLLA